MASLFDTADLESPQFGADVSGGADVYQGPPMETYREVRIEPPAQPQPKPRSIMERMQALTAQLVQPQADNNPMTSPLGMLSAGLVGFGEGYRGRGGEFLAQQGALHERYRNAEIERGKLGLEAMKEQRAQEKERREAKKEELKNKAFEQLADFDFSGEEMKSGKKLGAVVSTLLQAGDHATAASLIKMVQDASKDEKLRNDLNNITNRLKLAKDKNEADQILLDMPADVAKEHHSFLTGVVKSMFGDDKEKSLNTNDLIAFAESNGRLRGPTIPKDMTVAEAKATIKSQREMQQQQINVTTGQQNFQRASSIKDDYTKLVQPYMAARENMRKFEDLVKNPNKMTDLALVRQAMMAMDPPNAPSIVRESEAELVEHAKGSAILQPLAYHLERIAGKRTLTDEQRDQIKTLVRQSYNARRAGYEEQRKIQGEFAAQAGMNPEDVLGAELPPIVPKPTKGKAGATPAATPGTTPKYKVTEIKR